MGRRTGPLGCAGALIVTSLGFSWGKAHAAPLTVSLVYAAGPGCPDAADFRAVVTARLGYDPFVESAPRQVLVRIEPQGGAMDGRIEWRDSAGSWTGEQTFPSVSTDCSSLVRAMGFAVAVQIQLLAEKDTPPTSIVEAPVQITSPPQSASVRTRAPPAFAIGAGPSVGIGMSSSPVLLGRLFGGLAWQHVSIEIAAIVSLPATTRRPDGAGFSQQLLLGSAAACATTARWIGCAVANAGAVRMGGQDIDRPATATVPVVEAGARVGLIQRLGSRAFVGAHADGMVNLIRWTASLDQVPVWTAPRFAAALSVDAGVRFP
jgi:hypothetical protein